ncbi:MAG: hypothetical protein AB7I19_10120 [Planctomycetota bacterium]
MKSSVRAFSASVLLAAGLAAQPSYLPIRGYDIGFPPDAMWFSTSYRGQPAMVMSILGDRDIATAYDPRVLPPGTRHVRLSIREFAVYEPRPCALGTPLFFQETFPSGALPWGSITDIGFNYFPRPIDLFFSPGDPAYSNWRLTYCDAAACYSPCFPGDHTPLIETYLVTFAID